MELVERYVDKPSLSIRCIGDIQWSGEHGPTAKEHLKRHIEEGLENGDLFLGFGDYIDFMSPSNRQRMRSAALYDTAEDVIDNAAMELAVGVYQNFFKGTEGRWLGLLEGHHFYQRPDGTTTDCWLAEKLKAPFLGSSALVKIEYGKMTHTCTIYCHHGKGGGVTPGAPLNTLYHVAQGWDVDVVAMGHTNRTPATRFSRVFPIWDKKGNHELQHKEILLINTGSFTKSSIAFSKQGPIPRGDYAEARMLTPLPVSAPILHLQKGGRVTVEL